MSILQKSNKKASSRSQIQIQGVRDSVLLLPKHQYRAVIEVSAINFELKSEAEQDMLIDTYESFLNSLPCTIQIIVRIRELDMSRYVADLKHRLSDESDEIYKEQLEAYGDFVHDLVADNRILSRHFYIVVPYTSKSDDFTAVKEQLAMNTDIITKGCLRLGMHARRLSNLEILDLFQSFYNPEQAKRQPVTEQVLQLVSSAFIKGEK